MTLQEEITANAFEETFSALYPYYATAKTRYLHLIDSFLAHFSHHPTDLFSTPGRSELIGNHTDHQQGKVLATAINLDMIAAVSPREDGMIHVQTRGFPIPPLSIQDLAVKPTEFGTSTALIRGICARMQVLGYRIGGFNASIQSDILEGSGLSSSAAFEVLIATILSHLYNDGTINAITLAQISQYSENVYFDKPCGLMDQLACAVGGVIAIDFYDPTTPQVTPIAFNLIENQHELIIINTGGSHADLTEDYRAIGQEMQQVANVFHQRHLRHVEVTEFMEKLPHIRREVGDRAVLRAFHFFQENRRVEHAIDALHHNDFTKFKMIVRDSGASSFQYLQNVYQSHHPLEQNVAVALALTNAFLQDSGAYRVHGGGFAGTIQAFVPHQQVSNFIDFIDAMLGAGSALALTIRPQGTIKVRPHA